MARNESFTEVLLLSNLTTVSSSSIPNTTAEQDVPQPLLSCHKYSRNIFRNPFS